MKASRICTILLVTCAALAQAVHAGDALPGLTPQQLALFNAGETKFAEVDTIASGLGPVFNDQSCSVCHASPIVGGFGSTKVTRFGTITMGVFDPLDELGGSLRQVGSIDDTNCPEVVPPEATIVAERITPGILGFGLIEAIPDQTLIDIADEQDISGGTSGAVSGRVHMVFDVATETTRAGRFGWKSQVATLLTFSGDALLNEQGVTNRLFDTENAPQGDAAALAFCDTVADPEDGPDGAGLHRIDHMTHFMQLSAPPSPNPVSNLNGREKFKQVGCADCHVLMHMTGDSDVKAIAKRSVRPLSDFLLHELADNIQDGIQQGDAMMSEMRTAPLWDAHLKDEFMHDGRATTFHDAVLAHTNGLFEGEAGPAVLNYFFLNAQDQMDIETFVGSATPFCDTGDVDQSGVMDMADVDDFVDILLNSSMDKNRYCAADMNQDDYVDGDDIDLFLAKLLGP